MTRTGRCVRLLGRGEDRTRCNRSRGQAVTEFAIILPILVLVVAGILDFGFMLNSRMTIINAAREGADYGSSMKSSSWPTMDAAVKAQVAAVDTNLNAANLSVTVTCLVPSSLTTSPVTWSKTCTWSTVQTGDAVQVTVAYQYHTFFPLLFGTVINMSTSDQVVIFPPSS